MYGAIALCSILEIDEELYISYNLIMTSIQCADVFIRSDRLSGYLNRIDAVSEGSVARTSGYPFYLSLSDQMVSISDVYIAALILQVQYCAPSAFISTCRNLHDEVQSGAYTPHMFFRTVIVQRFWGNEGRSVKEFLKRFVTEYKPEESITLTSETKDEIVSLLKDLWFDDNDENCESVQDDDQSDNDSDSQEEESDDFKALKKNGIFTEKKKKKKKASHAATKTDGPTKVIKKIRLSTKRP